MGVQTGSFLETGFDRLPAVGDLAKLDLGTDDVVEARAGIGKSFESRIELQIVAVADNQPVVRVIQNETLGDTFDDDLSGPFGGGPLRANSASLIRVASRMIPSHKTEPSGRRWGLAIA